MVVGSTKPCWECGADGTELPILPDWYTLAGGGMVIHAQGYSYPEAIEQAQRVFGPIDIHYVFAGRLCNLLLEMVPREVFIADKP